MKTMLANLRHAAHNRQTLHIGGGEFSPAETKQFIKDVKDATRVVETLRSALDKLLEQTVDMDMQYGVQLTSGEKEAREQAIAAMEQSFLFLERTR